MDTSYVGKRQEPVTLVLLSILTCGIYGAYWLYITGKDINAVLGRDAVNPVLAIVGMFCAPVILYYLYTLDRELVEVGNARGIEYKQNFVLWIVLAIVCGIGLWVAYFQIPKFLNSVWDNSEGQNLQ